MFDVTVQDHGSITAFVFNTGAAQDFAEEKLQAESWQYLGGSLCVDTRYAGDLIVGMEDDGLTVEYL